MFPGLECLLELLSLHLYFHCNLCISSRLKCMRCSSQDNETIYMGRRQAGDVCHLGHLIGPFIRQSLPTELPFHLKDSFYVF